MRVNTQVNNISPLAAATPFYFTSDAEKKAVTDTLIDRLPANLLKKVLGIAGVPNVGYKEGLKELVNNECVQPTNSHKLDRLSHLLLDHIIFGNKKIRVFHTPTSSLINNFTSQETSIIDLINANQYAGKILTRDQINDLPERLQTKLWMMYSGNGFVHLIFRAIRRVTERDTLNHYEIANGRYNEVYGVRHIYDQCFDVISIHQNNTIQIKIDLYRNHEHRNLFSNTDIENQFSHLKSQFLSILRNQLGYELEFPRAHDFTPAIESLLLNESCNITNVKQLDNQGYDMHIKGLQDIRNSLALQHANQALENVGDIPKRHMLRATFTQPLANHTYEVDLELTAPPFVHNIAVAVINDATIKDNLGSNDYNQVMNRILI